jgi:S1-C subfamily serine protease
MGALPARTVIFLSLALLAPWVPAGARTEPAPSAELARGLIEAERFDEAVGVLKALNADTTTAAAEIDLLFGRIYLAIGKPAKSEPFFERALTTSLEGEGEAYLGLAEAQLAQGQIAKARRNAGHAVKSDPDLVAAHLVLARADQRVGQGREALARLRKLQQDRPDAEDVAVVLARYLSQQDGPVAGVAELERFTGLYPTAARAQDALGQLLWAGGRKAEAVQARTLAGQLYRERGQVGRAEAMAVWLKAVDPEGRMAREVKRAEPPVSAPAPVPTPTVREPAREPPRPVPQPRPPVEAEVLPPAPAPIQVPIQAPVREVRKARPPAAVLPQPEPLPFTPGSAIMTGSGVVLEGGRQIITNRHVVEGMRSIAVRNGTGYVRTARIVKLSSDDDLALLEIDRPFPEGAVMPIADIVEPATGRAAIVMGYPMIGLFGDEQPALTEGIVAKTLGLGNDPNTFQMTAKINKGNSGGPVFDRRGRLLGVIVGKTDTAGLFEKSGAMVEDINLGIKGGRILRFLGKPASAGQGGPEMGLEELYQEMLPRAVLIAAQK